MNKGKRTIECGVLGVEHVGKEVTLNGWAHRQRDFGDLVFIDLRDRTGSPKAALRISAEPPTAGSTWDRKSR